MLAIFSKVVWVDRAEIEHEARLSIVFQHLKGGASVLTADDAGQNVDCNLSQSAVEERSERVERGGGRVAKIKSTVCELTLVGGRGPVSVIHDYAFLKRTLDVLVVVEDDFFIAEGFVDTYVHRDKGGAKESE